jgi:hypothetical protein
MRCWIAQVACCVVAAAAEAEAALDLQPNTSPTRMTDAAAATKKTLPQELGRPNYLYSLPELELAIPSQSHPQAVVVAAVHPKQKQKQMRAYFHNTFLLDDS